MNVPNTGALSWFGPHVKLWVPSAQQHAHCHPVTGGHVTHLRNGFPQVGRDMGERLREIKCPGVGKQLCAQKFLFLAFLLPFYSRSYRRWQPNNCDQFVDTDIQ